jgi:16S rRNA (cytosine1402-N4)-methyltransferase
VTESSDSAPADAGGPVHIPVLVDAVLAHLAVRPGGRYIDATVDGGGHTRALLAASAPGGRVLGVDRDPEILTALRARLAAPIEAGRLQLVCSTFAELGRVAAAHGCAAVDGIVFDLGLSSYHLDASGRGFSLARDEPLDMRFDPTDAARETAADILHSRDADELTALFRTYGEERFASRIARSIVARRRVTPLRTTGELLDAVAQSLPAKIRWRAARDAARIFQALRIATNDELDAVAEALPQALAALAPGGRLVVISFHSLEDRLVKHFLRDAHHAGRIRILTKRPITPPEDEVRTNPRAASAKLRAAERTAT